MRATTVNRAGTTIMQHLKTGIAALATTVLLYGCASGFKATHDFDETKDFATYKTFAWISEHPMKLGATERIINPLIEQRIMGTVENALQAKGYTKVGDAESADFALGFTVGSREEVHVNTSPSMTSTHIGYGYARRGVWGGAYYGSPTETTVRQYTKGMLAIDVFDVAERRPVWHGVGTKTINESDREDAAGTVEAAVDAILAGFPPV